MGFDLVKLLAPALALCAGCTINVHNETSARAKCVKADCEAEAAARASRSAEGAKYEQGQAQQP